MSIILEKSRHPLLNIATLLPKRICLVTALLFGSAVMVHASGNKLIHSINKAPISIDGDVAAAVTDFVINLDFDMDPSAQGLNLQPSQTLSVELPDTFQFDNAEEFPVRNILSAKDCAPNIVKCTTAVFLHGWPQHPILPRNPKTGTEQFDFSFDSNQNAFLFKIKTDTNKVFLPGPGIKQIHLLAFGFRNPENPGEYPIKVSIIDADGGVIQSDTAVFDIKPAIAPSINITSVFVPNDENDGKPPNPNTIYQSTNIGQSTPMPWDFLTWGADSKPLVGIVLDQHNDNGGDILVAGVKIGSFEIHAPQGASGQTLTGVQSVTIPGTPVIGKTFGDLIPAGRMTARFKAWNVTGRYETILHLEGGNSVKMIVDAVQ